MDATHAPIPMTYHTIHAQNLSELARRLRPTERVVYISTAPLYGLSALTMLPAENEPDTDGGDA